MRDLDVVGCAQNVIDYTRNSIRINHFYINIVELVDEIKKTLVTIYYFR